MRNLLLMLGLSLATALSSNAAQNERYDINYRHQFYDGQSVLNLKQDLKDQFNIKPNRLELKRVVLFAKSKHGQGQASLKVGDYESDTQTVGGRLNEFNSKDPDTYERIVMRLPNKEDDNGVWQIKLRGNIRVMMVRVVVDTDDHDNGNGNSGQACFYKHANYGGQSICIKVGGNYENLASTNLNDEISSVRFFGKARTAKVCTDAYLRGNCYIINRDMSYVGDYLNDRISSILVW